MPTSKELFARFKVLHDAARNADDAYSKALDVAYKKNAGDMRYRPDLQPDHIRALGKAFVSASNAWGPLYLEACELQRAEDSAQVKAADP